MADFNTTIGTVISSPFITNFPFPIDNRMVVENENGRLSIPLPVQYEGMLVYQKDINTFFVLNTVGVGAAAQYSIITTSESTSTFPFTGSAAISGSLQVHGPTTITAPSSSDLFLVKIHGQEESKFVINLEGVTILGAFDEAPTAQAGGMFYSSSGDFYLGS
tara:strand:+ start:2345 stop:2830 length:486 start_codon:yes stop_codon:yes gene_type:complete